MENFTAYSARAEMHDICHFMSEVAKYDEDVRLVYNKIYYDDNYNLDYYWEFYSNYSLEQLYQLMKLVEQDYSDIYLLAQTLNYSDEFDGERFYERD